MSNNKSNTYTLEFKQHAAELAANSDQSISQTARDLGLKLTTLYGWMTKYGHKKHAEPLGQSGIDKELKRLQKENARLKMERDILKKAAAYFASEME